MFVKPLSKKYFLQATSSLYPDVVKLDLNK